MFNFTTTTLIHSVDQFIANPSNNNKFSSHNTLLVNGVNLFKKENVVAIYRNPYVAPLAGRLVVDINNVFRKAEELFPEDGVPTKIRFRLKFSLRRTGDNNSYYARDEVFKGKDFVYEWAGDDGTTAAQVAKQIKKINRLYGDIFLDVHEGTSADDQVLKDYDGNSEHFGTPVGTLTEKTEVEKLVFVNDNYGMFTDATIQVWMDGYSDCCHYQEGGWVDIDTIELYDSICVNNCTMLQCEEQTRGIKESTLGLLHIVDCVNGVGTYDQILRDLRLPTMENLGYMSLTQQMNEMPVPGMKYVQYTLHYVTCRGILGGSAVGEVTHSKTTHVFFVPATCCDCENTPYVDVDTAFRTALQTAFGWTTCDTTGKLVPAPHDNPVAEPLYGNQLAPAALNSTRTSNNVEGDADLTQTQANISGGGGDVPNLYCFNSQTGSINNPGGGNNGKPILPSPGIGKSLGKEEGVEIEVDKNSDDDEVETKITTDGSIPKVSSPTYNEPFEVETGTAIKAINYKETTGETSLLVETVAKVEGGTSRP